MCSNALRVRARESCTCILIKRCINYFFSATALTFNEDFILRSLRFVADDNAFVIIPAFYERTFLISHIYVCARRVEISYGSIGQI
jgi:hypothetical protein